MIQTWAMIVDAYRELNARKLFWVTLGISVLVVAAQASLGISEKGVTLLWFEFPFPIFNSTVVEPAAFHKLVFYTFGYSIWLTWAATILALISTASIIPDFVSSGSIELSLSKPVGRARLFLTKYLTGVLFVTLQVAVFSVLSFLVIGIRGGAWELSLFWSVPIVVVFFSYLYALSALVGLLTRSPITALLATGIVWILIVAIHGVETGFLLQSVTANRLGVAAHVTEIETKRGELEAARRAAEEGEASAPDAAGEVAAAEPKKPAVEGEPEAPAWSGMDALLDAQEQRKAAVKRIETELADLEAKKTLVEEELRTQERYHTIALTIKTILPKTTETSDLLGRWLLTGDELEGVRDRAEQEAANRVRRPRGRPIGAVRVAERAIERELQAELRRRTELWVVGTSLGFEAAVLGVACLIFCRRDF
ncbi:MAG: hypothetical protein AB7K52_08035 [Phycisphaerales bacterium]